MKQITREWVEKAEGDFASAGRELRARKVPNYDAACFHAQQSAEKYLKALLQESGIDPPRIHHLPTLLGLLPSAGQGWGDLRDDLVALSHYAVDYRYPGESADKDMARQAVSMCDKVRDRARSSLRLKS